jgi:branched-chain amino acid transport system ATP-binding protein
MTARFSCTALTGGRGAAIAFRDVDLAVESGQLLTLLGPNGAGKTTLLLTLAGLLPARKGGVAVDGVALRNGRPALANRSGIVLVPDNRSLFTTMSVAENLRVAARRQGPAPRDMLDVFPALAKRWDLRAGALSGGEQQMLAMARALIQQPKVLLVDELSMGLAPLVVEALFDAVRRIASEHGCAVVLVEQHVNLALGVADHVAVLNHGSVVLSADGDTVRAHPDQLEQAYFGTLVST